MSKNIVYVFIGISITLIIKVIFDYIAESEVKNVIAIFAVIIPAFATVFVAIFNHQSNKNREMALQKTMKDKELEVQKLIGQREIDESHRQKKVEIYKAFITLLGRMLVNVPDKRPKEQEIIKTLAEFQNNILLWGGPKVIKAYVDYRNYAFDSDDSQSDAESIDISYNVFFYADSIYKALREDIGLSNEGLDNLETVKIYMQNPKELDRIIQKSTNNKTAVEL